MKKSRMDSKPPVLLLLLLDHRRCLCIRASEYGQCSLNFTARKIINLRKSNLSFLFFSRMESKPPVLLLLFAIIGAAFASELAEYGQCSLNFTARKIINLRKSNLSFLFFSRMDSKPPVLLLLLAIIGAASASELSHLEDCSHSCCDDTAGQCSVAVYHNDRNMDNCYHINCPDPQACVYQDLAGYTLAIISRAVPQAEALGGTSTEKPATATTKTASTKSPEVNVIPEERMFTEKQQETTTTKSEVKLTTEQPGTVAQPHTNATEQPGTPQQTTAAGGQPNLGSEQPTTEQHVPDTEQQTKPATKQPNPGTEQQQQMSTKPSSQLTTVTKTTTTPKTQSTQTFTQKQTTKTTTTSVVGKTTGKVEEALQTTQASKTPEVAIQEIKQTTPSIAASTQKPTTKVQTVPPTNPPPTEKPSPSPVPSTKPTTTTSKQTQAVTTKANPVPEATAAQTKASSTGKTPDVTAAETQPPTAPTSKPAAATTKKLMPESTAKEDHAVTPASLGSIGPQVDHRNESLSAADKLGKSSYGSLIVAMCFGLLFLFAVIVVVGKRWYESWQRRHYSKIDYLINGMYN
uniref:MANSC domain-containing protein n=1 Tax=Branchiostoma floridae TaxID=7739 RepID=C3ZCB3_BRAFL|eukprot:XP_002593874.1 hypothetical protein BRAFLDRAFT_75668 [Branchiostoma floridae]